jgi:hypothetical protein
VAAPTTVAASAAPAAEIPGLVIHSEVEPESLAQAQHRIAAASSRGRFRAKLRSKRAPIVQRAIGAKTAAPIESPEPASAVPERAPLRAAEAKPAPAAEAKATHAPEAKPARAPEAKPEDLALKAAASVPSQPKAQEKAAGDDSLDALMEHAVESKKKGHAQAREDDPIFGL